MLSVSIVDVMAMQSLHSDEAVSIGGEGKYSMERENVCVSMAVCRHLEVPVGGMQSYYWPCR